jgi:hypothetical protein
MMIDLATTYDLKPGDVREIVLELNPYEARYPGTDSRGPFMDQGGTLMSGQFCMALALRERKATLDGLFRFDDPGLGELVRRARIIADETMPPLSSRLTVVTVDGRRLTRETMATPRTHKFSFDEDAALVRGLVPEMGVGADVVEHLIAAVRGLERQSDVSALLACFTPRAGSTAGARR